MTQYMIFLVIVPVCCFELTKIYSSKYRHALNGISIGLVIAPLSLALQEFSCIPVIGNLLGCIGAVSHLPHGLIGYCCLLNYGLVSPESTMTAMQLTWVNLINGVIFAYLYGAIGFMIDRMLQKRGSLQNPLFH